MEIERVKQRIECTFPSSLKTNIPRNYGLLIFAIQNACNNMTAATLT
ncbi:hypothetical protein BTN49_2582 [Candidatus Enterovibrio escicola]|uniref:Uncharacterized protein n=1 Tax=Candidatus Enterovibrio escicola TaxID=1927127 RepID=A0A2A5T0U0_9GAMM|nr:hypothetical protein BTN49_2582 [Candidatus Enterovibrio escacola]